MTLYGGNKQNGSALINSDNLTLDSVSKKTACFSKVGNIWAIIL